MSKHPGLLRSRDSHARVTFVELFFDLVFVFAVTQLSHTLVEHLTLGGALQTLFLLLAVWWVWMYTCWFTNWIDPDKPSVRMLMFALMLAGLLMSAAIPNAFGHEGLLFAHRVRVHPGHAVGVHVLRRAATTRSTTATSSASPPGSPCRRCSGSRGGIAGGYERVAAWVLALSLEIGGPFVGYFVPGLGRSNTTDWKVDGAHMAERCALFVMIALGESILVTGATAASLPATTARDLRVPRGVPRQRGHVVDLLQHRRRARQPRNHRLRGSGALCARRVHVFPHSRSLPASWSAPWPMKSRSRIPAGTWNCPRPLRC